jgi:CheY-like chemotaxis protein
MTERAPQTPPSIVLVAESDVLVRMTISAYLRDCGYRVVEAATGAEALVILKGSQVPVDIVLAEADLDGNGGGFALSQWVRSNRPKTEVILAGNAEAATNAAGDICDKGPMLARPYEPQAALDLIKRLLAARSEPG